MFDQPSYIVREHVGFLKLTDTYDILDPAAGGKQAGIAQERISGGIKLLRLLVNKQILPTTVAIVAGEDPKGPAAIEIRRGWPFGGGVRVFDGQGRQLGSFKTKLFSLGGAFDLVDPAGKLVARIKGDWRGKNYKFLDDAGAELGAITKQWAGLGKELFTSADTYVVALAAGAPQALMPLLLAAGIAIDVLYHEQG